MSRREVRLLLNDILEAAQKIKVYVSEYSYSQFIDDSKTLDAVIRNFEIIGEASNRLPFEFKDTNSDVDWYRIVGFRNRIVHDYMGIDYEIVWVIIQEYLDILIAQIQKIVDTL